MNPESESYKKDTEIIPRMGLEPSILLDPDWGDWVLEINLY